MAKSLTGMKDPSNKFSRPGRTGIEFYAKTLEAVKISVDAAKYQRFLWRVPDCK